MGDKSELKTIALRSALDLVAANRGASRTVEEVVKDAKAIHDFLVKEEDDKEDT
ncbi:MAG: hypothetical protein ACUZ8I_07345 [Candidatus Scalindua sp.]